MHHHCHSHGWHGAGRRWHGDERHGFGGFGTSSGRGGGSFRPGKMLADGDLRIIVLALLAEQPRHGYDIIKALEERSHRSYSPSPGVVYPTLTYLEEAGYASASNEGNKKVYAITEAGQKHLADNRDIAGMIFDGMNRIGERMAKARAWYYRHEGDNSFDIPGVIREVNEARRALKQAIAEKFDASEAEQQRMAEALREAADKIRGSGESAS
jgi:DNA-binding PadR family transcriptional regulator